MRLVAILLSGTPSPDVAKLLSEITCFARYLVTFEYNGTKFNGVAKLKDNKNTILQKIEVDFFFLN